jgi:hypothetical protein
MLMLNALLLALVADGWKLNVREGEDAKTACPLVEGPTTAHWVYGP